MERERERETVIVNKPVVGLVATANAALWVRVPSAKDKKHLLSDLCKCKPSPNGLMPSLVIHPHYGPHPLYIQSFVPTPNKSHPFGPFFRKQMNKILHDSGYPAHKHGEYQNITRQATINLLHTKTPTLTLDRELYDHHRPLPQKLQCIIG